MTNDNQFSLYRIRRKSDGKYLTTAPKEVAGGADHISWYWNKTGCFWKQQETIREHLLSLCQLWMYCGSGQSFSKKTRNGVPFVVYPHGTFFNLVGTYPEWVDKYEVVQTVVNEMSTTTIDGRDFANFNSLQTA